MLLSLDHIVIASTSLTQGVSHVKEQLNVAPSFGGEHAIMNTHNHLMKLGQDEFLEIISVNPDAPAPNRSRWFALDEFNEDKPRLITWVARTDNIEDALEKTSFINWQVLNVSRGQLKWKIAVPDDGSLPFDGAFPTIIEWPTRPFPGSKMTGFECSLGSLRITHPDADELNTSLSALINDPRISITRGEYPFLSASIDTPDGAKNLT